MSLLEIRRPSPSTLRKRPVRRPQVEVLEGRTLMAGGPIKMFGFNNFYNGAVADKMRAAGMNAVRVEGNASGGTTYLGTWDQAFATAAARGLSVLPLLNEPYTSVNHATFAANVKVFAARYGPGGTFWAGRSDATLAPPIIEITNEPYGQWYYANPDAASYADLYMQAVEQGHAGNPNVRFSMAGFQMDYPTGGAWKQNWDNQVYLAGGSRLINDLNTAGALAYHPYYDPGAPLQFTQPASYGGTTRGYWRFKQGHDFWTSKGVSTSVPFIATELGGNLHEVSASTQATMVGYYYDDCQANAWCAGMYIYSSMDDRTGAWGVLDSATNPRASYTAIKNAIASTQYDFGTATSPVAPGYVRVTGATRYSASQGYGWQVGTVVDRDRGTPDSLRRDFNFTQDATFAVAVPNGSYDVTVTLGDAQFAHDQQGIFLEGAQKDSVTTSVGQFVTRTYRVSVGDGRLDLRLRDLGGRDLNAVINALEVRAVPGVQTASVQTLSVPAAARPDPGASTRPVVASVQELGPPSRPASVAGGRRGSRAPAPPEPAPVFPSSFVRKRVNQREPDPAVPGRLVEGPLARP